MEHLQFLLYCVPAMALYPYILPHTSRLFQLEHTFTRLPSRHLLNSLLDISEQTLQIYKSGKLIAFSDHLLQDGVLLQQVGVDLLCFGLLTDKVGMEVRVRVLQVRQDLPEAVQLGGHVHEAITLFLHNLDDLVREHLQILSKARSCSFDLP